MAPALPPERCGVIDAVLSTQSETNMQTKKLVVIGLVAVTGLAIAGFAMAQGPGHGQHSGMQPGHGMHMGHGMQAMMHDRMQRGPQGGPSMTHDQPHARATGDQSVPSLAFTATNEKMHRDMAIKFTGEVDVDFARGMIPHHQGAIDMAKITLAFGKDPEIRKLAEEIVKAQETEIAFMRSWLAKKGSN